MSAPTVKRVKVYAVVESVVDAPQDQIDKYLREHKFKGNTTINYSQGGVTNVVTREIIPLTMKQLDLICNGDN
jgi:hypothetical protein